MPSAATENAAELPASSSGREARPGELQSPPEPAFLDRAAEPGRAVAAASSAVLATAGLIVGGGGVFFFFF